MTPHDLFLWLERCREAGALRRLDVAFARFVHETASDAPTSLLLAAALLAQMEGRGHSGLPLEALDAACRGSPGSTPDLGAVFDAMDETVAVGAGAGAGAESGAASPAMRPTAEGADWAGAFADWPLGSDARRAAWGGCPAVEIEPATDAGRSPLVLSAGLLYLRRYWRCEVRVAAQIRARTTGVDGALPKVDDPALFDVASARALLARLFPPPVQGTAPAIDWQQVACAVAVRGRLSIVTGGPGTGKTYTAARLLVLMQAIRRSGPPTGSSTAQSAGPHLRVGLAAPTGKAAARLRQSIHKAFDGLRATLGPELIPDAALLAGPATTLHTLLGTQHGTRRFRHDATTPLELDVLFVDEASMVHLEMMAQLLEALPPQARVVLLGDKDQLASVEAGSVLGDLCHDAGAGYRPDTVQWVQALTGQVLPDAACGAGSALAQQTVVLRHSHRFDGPIGRLAECINLGDAVAALRILRETPVAVAEGTEGIATQPAVAPGAASPLPVALVEGRDASVVLPLALRGRDGAPGGYGAYLRELAQRPSDTAPGAAFDDWVRRVLTAYEAFRVLCAVREGPWGVSGLNGAIERALVDSGGLQRRGEWYEGRPVMVTRNQPALGVFNGDIGIVLRSPTAALAAGLDGPAGAGGSEGSLRAWFLDGDALRSVSVGRLADVETAFAMTVHKSQGSEFAHVAMVLPDDDVPVLTRELLYTGITRARTAFTLIGPQASLASLLGRAVARRTRRVSGLRSRL